MNQESITLHTIRKFITTNDILEAYEAHGDEFMIIDIYNLKKSQYSQYISIFIKKADGDIINPTYWKLSSKGLMVSSSIKEPSKRVYSQVRIGISHLSKMNDTEEETDNTKALKILCEVYERKMKELKDNKLISDDEKECSRKIKDTNIKPVHFISTKIVTAMQTMSIDQKSGEVIELKNPYYWITIPIKRFYNSNEEKKESVHFNNQYYYDPKKNSPDLTKPIMTFEYSPTFYNIDSFIHHPRTGKKTYKRIGDIDEDDVSAEPTLDNTNIHKYLTRNSAIVGNLKFEIVVAGRQAKLEIYLNGNIYVRQGSSSYTQVQDDDCLDEFSDLYSTISASKKSLNYDSDMVDEPDIDDF